MSGNFEIVIDQIKHEIGNLIEDKDFFHSICNNISTDEILKDIKKKKIDLNNLEDLYLFIIDHPYFNSLLSNIEDEIHPDKFSKVIGYRKPWTQPGTWMGTLVFIPEETKVKILCEKNISYIDRTSTEELENILKRLKSEGWYEMTENDVKLTFGI